MEEFHKFLISKGLEEFIEQINNSEYCKCLIYFIFKDYDKCLKRTNNSTYFKYIKLMLSKISTNHVEIFDKINLLMNLGCLHGDVEFMKQMVDNGANDFEGCIYLVGEYNDNNLEKVLEFLLNCQNYSDDILNEIIHWNNMKINQMLILHGADVPTDKCTRSKYMKFILGEDISTRIDRIRDRENAIKFSLIDDILGIIRDYL